MTTKNLGRISPSPKGAWSSQTKYAGADIVRHKTTAYIALCASLDVEPTVHPLWETYWMPLTSDGDTSDLDMLAQAIDSAASVINMSVSADTVDAETPPSVSFTVGESGDLDVLFRIPRNTSLPNIKEEAVFYLDGGSWEVVEVVATSNTEYTVTSLGTQDFSSLQYSFSDGMTWDDFASSENNIVIGGQLGAEYPGEASIATSGRNIVCMYNIGFALDTNVVCFADYEQRFVDYFDIPSKTLYLDGVKVEPTDLIVPNGKYTAQ